MIRKRANRMGIILFLALSGSCLPVSSPMAPPGAAMSAPSLSRASEDLILATTTSFQDSGLLDVLLKRFEEISGIRVKAIAVGSGEAIRMGEQGSADVLVVHSPADEEKFMAAGLGLDRKELMSNDFVLVGPENDPAGVRSLSIADAFRILAGREALFVSRADGSGTHKKEKSIWKKAGCEPKGDWYIETGQGMAESLRIAGEKSGYALTDRGTYLAVREKLGLGIVVEGGKELLNVYHVITLNPERFPKANLKGARAFMDFLLNPETQKVIGAFGREKFGMPLFMPVQKEAGATTAE